MAGPLLPVADYRYGSLTRLDGALRLVEFGQPFEVPRPAAAEAAEAIALGGSHTTSTLLGSPLDPVRLDVVSMRHVIRDFTGDGVADLVFKSGGSWHLYAGGVSDEGPDLEAGGYATWTQPAEIHRQTTRRYLYPSSASERAAMVTTETFVAFADWNGDGRLDIVDVDSGPGIYYWRIWLNRPSTTAALEWEPHDVHVGDLADHIMDYLDRYPYNDASSDRVAIERTRSWPRLESFDCNVYRHNADTDENQVSDCDDLPDYFESGQVDSVTEWKLADVNGDSFPDLVANSLPVRECETNDPEPGTLCPHPEGWVSNSQSGGWPWEMQQCSATHREYVQMGWCPDDDFWPEQPLNTARVLINREGALTNWPHQDRSYDAAYYGVAALGLDRWTTGNETEGPYDPTADMSVSWRSGGFMDEHGLGKVKYRTFEEPGGYEQFDSDQHVQCGYSSSNTYTSTQVSGLVDLNGDGIPDHVYRNTDNLNAWSVRFGTSGGFGRARRLRLSGNGPFAISETHGSCEGGSTTTAGLVDLDGDGKPEFVRSQGGVLMAAQVLSSEGEPGALDAGRLVAIENGYGAVTEIQYANNKAEPHTSHSVPVPEIVVAETQTFVMDGSAPDSVPVRHAYGTAESRYDPITGRSSFAGYRRMVTLVGGPSERTGATLIEGFGAVVDRVPQSPFASGFQAFAVGGRVEHTFRLAGVFSPDPRALLPAGAPDPWVQGKSTQTYAVAELPVAQWTTSVGIEECVDVDVDTGTGFFDEFLCHRAGIVHLDDAVSWEGTQSPDQGDANVIQGRTVLEVDDRGRPIEVIDYGDLRTIADERCTTIQYAVPGTGSSRATSVVSGIWTTDCGWTNPVVHTNGMSPGAPIMLAGQRFRYDGLLDGHVGQGRLTSHVIERYDTSDGSALGEHVVATLEYGSLGEIEKVTSTRALGGLATRITIFDHDDFGLTVRTTSESATDVVQPPFVREEKISTWPSVPHEETDLNGVKTVTTRDRFGRPDQTRLVAPGVDHLISDLDYDDDPGGRQVTKTIYPAAAGVAQRSHVRLDALGRPRFRQMELGADYNFATIVSDLVEFDGFGREIYRAAPFEWAVLPFMPDDLPADAEAWPFGTAIVYDSAGRPRRLVEAPGKRPFALTSDPDADIFVSDFEHLWLAGRAVTRSQGPGENHLGGASFGARDETAVTALGWPVESARFDGGGTRVDLVRRGFDRFGSESVVRRFKSPATAAGAVDWVRRYDSLGQVLRLEEPGTAPVLRAYDEWGGLLQSQWMDGQVLKLTRQRYDGFGRQTLSEIVTISQGTETVEAIEQAFYDEHSGSPQQPTSELRGRLSWIDTRGVGQAFFEYDVMGRGASESYVLSGHDQLMRTSRIFEPGGAMRELRFETPAGNDRIEYRLDSAMRTKSITDVGTGVRIFDGTEIDALTGYEQIRLGNGTSEVFSFAPDGRRELEHWSVSTNSGLRDHGFVMRDADGRVLHEAVNHFGSIYSVNHTYDVLGRLTRSTSLGPSQSQDEEFTYSPLGNLTKKRNYASPGQDRDYKYDDAIDPDRLCRFDSPGQSGPGCTAHYDAAGNQVMDTWSPNGTMRHFSYDAASRTREIKRGTWRANFYYGPGGGLARTDVWDGSSLHRRVWSFGDLIEERRRPDGRVHIERRIPGPLGIVATLRSERSKRETIYVHGDGRANRFFTRTDGKIPQELRYRAFGGVIQDSGAPSAITYTDDLWNGGDDLRELGVVVLGARIFDPTVGRFLQRDPIAFSGSSTHGNPYSFAFNDPVNYNDPTGLFGSWLGCMAAPLCITKSSSGFDSTSGALAFTVAFAFPTLDILLTGGPAGVDPATGSGPEWITAAAQNLVASWDCSTACQVADAFGRAAKETVTDMWDAGVARAKCIAGKSGGIGGVRQAIGACVGAEAYAVGSGLVKFGIALAKDPAGALEKAFCGNSGDCTKGAFKFGIGVATTLFGGRVAAGGGGASAVSGGILRSGGNGSWISRAGLRYGADPIFGNRVRHVLNHASDDLARQGAHGVFDAGRRGTLAVVDEAWTIAQGGGARVSVATQGPRTIYTVDMGRRVGFVGGQAGSAAGNPAASFIRLVMQGDDVVTAYPVRP